MLLCAASSFALNYNVLYTSNPPTIDGTVDAVWATASPAARNFVSHQTTTSLSTQQTSVRVLWDSTKLYLLYEADDSAIVAPATGNDTGFTFGTQDTAEIFLDPAFIQAATPATNNDIFYHIAVNPAAGAFTYTEAGQNQTAWNLGPNSQVAFSSSGTNWKIEMAIPFTELNSTLANSPGIVAGAPGNGSVWGAQFARSHFGAPDNNFPYTKWEPTAGSFKNRAYGTLTFTGAPAPTKIDLSDRIRIYSTSFEEPTFTAGSTANGKGGWTTAAANTFLTTNTVVLSGTQALEARAGTGAAIASPAQTSQSLTAAGYLQYAVRLPAEVGNNYRHVLYAGGEYTTGTDTLTQIWFFGQTAGQGGNTITVYSYDTLGSDTPVQVKFAGLQAFNEWSYVTLKADPATKTFELWYNGTKLQRPNNQPFNVKKRSIFTRLRAGSLYNKSYGTAPVFFDEFAQYVDVVPTSASDWQTFE